MPVRLTGEPGAVDMAVGRQVVYALNLIQPLLFCTKMRYKHMIDQDETNLWHQIRAKKSKVLQRQRRMCSDL